MIGRSARGAGVIVAVCVTAAAGPSRADVRPPPSPALQPAPAASALTSLPPTPEVAAAAKARADALIAAAHAEAYFDNISEGAEPRVRHKASGMECVFAPDGPAAIVLDAAPGASPGESAACTTTSVLDSGDRAIVTLRAAKLAGANATLDQALAAVAADVKRTAPGAKPLAGQFPHITLSGDKGGDAPVQKALRFQVAGRHTPPTYLRAAAGVAGGWAITQTSSAPLAQAGDADLLSEVMLNVALIDVFYAGQKAAEAKAP